MLLEHSLPLTLHSVPPGPLPISLFLHSLEKGPFVWQGVTDVPEQREAQRMAAASSDRGRKMARSLYRSGTHWSRWLRMDSQGSLVPRLWINTKKAVPPEASVAAHRGSASALVLLLWKNPPVWTQNQINKEQRSPGDLRNLLTDTRDNLVFISS